VGHVQGVARRIRDEHGAPLAHGQADDAAIDGPGDVAAAATRVVVVAGAAQRAQRGAAGDQLEVGDALQVERLASRSTMSRAACSVVWAEVMRRVISARMSSHGARPGRR